MNNEDILTNEMDYVLQITPFMDTGDMRELKKGKLLGKGGGAKCYEFICLKTDKVYAAKTYLKPCCSKTKELMVSEINIHKTLIHPGVVKFEGSFEDKCSVYILLELCEKQTLNNLLCRRKIINESEALGYMVHVIDALKYIHSEKVIHRDIRPSSIYLSDKIKIGDFSRSARFEYEGERKYQIEGCPFYMAPEMLNGKGYSYEVDIYALGAMLYRCLIGDSPVMEHQGMKLVRKKAIIFPDEPIVSDSVKSLIFDLLNSDPLKRPSLDEILHYDCFIKYINLPQDLPSLLSVEYTDL
jgi:serine/threonine protein kinase